MSVEAKQEDVEVDLVKGGVGLDSVRVERILALQGIIGVKFFCGDVGVAQTRWKRSPEG